jgi:hypothetical protein
MALSEKRLKQIVQGTFMSTNKTCPKKWASMVSGDNPYAEEVNKRISAKTKDWDNYMSKEDDMEFMREVFMPDVQGDERPKLPFSKYIYDWGEHPLMEQMDSADRARHGSSFFARYTIPRPDGTLTGISVVCGSYFYSRKDAPYEVLLIADDGNDNEPLGYQTDEDLMMFIAKLLNEGDTK